MALRRSRDPGGQCCPQLTNTEGANNRNIEAQSRRFTTRSRLVGYTFTGQGSNLLDCDNRFRLFHKLPPLQDFVWRNGNFQRVLSGKFEYSMESCRLIYASNGTDTFNLGVSEDCHEAFAKMPDRAGEGRLRVPPPRGRDPRGRRTPFGKQ